MKVHLLDGTYELFRHHFGQPEEARTSERGATRGVLGSVLWMLSNDRVTHLAVATDHVIESFRNEMWPGYKSSTGMPPQLLAQFGLLEDGLAALGVRVWPMVELEADDALASGAAVARDDPRVDQVVICTPDKDMAQCVTGDRVVLLDRRKNLHIDEAGVKAKFGVLPPSIPDYLALVGDSADGFPGLAGWGAKSAALVLAHYGHIDAIPPLAKDWDVAIGVRGALKLAATLDEQRDLALLFRDLATLRVDRSLLDDVEQLRWVEPRPELVDIARHLDAPDLVDRAFRVAEARTLS